jgi:transposase-like protein
MERRRRSGSGYERRKPGGPEGPWRHARPEIQLHTADGHIRPLADIEADVVRLALVLHGGSITEAAKALGIGRSTFYRKVRVLASGHEAGTDPVSEVPEPPASTARTAPRGAQRGRRRKPGSEAQQDGKMRR